MLFLAQEKNAIVGEPLCMRCAYSSIRNTAEVWCFVYLGGVAVALHVVAVGVVVHGLLIEIAGVPVAALAGRLGTEVYPEAHLASRSHSASPG